jgi:hypothetical protein
MANARKEKNHIHSLLTDNCTTTLQSDKHSVVYDHFQQHLGTYIPRGCRLNFNNLGWQSRNLQHLEAPISQDEVYNVIMKSPNNKALGPNGFIGWFFATCWKTIKDDVMKAMDHFFNLNQQRLYLLNHAFIVLIPKKNCLQRIGNYTPISLTHSFAKIIAKILSNRLGPELNNLVATIQTTFIKTRCIHDSFMYVQQMIKTLHRKRVPTMFIKIDILKAFHTVNWLYLLDIMAYLGFGQH